MQPDSTTPAEGPALDRPWNVRGRVVTADVDSVVAFTAVHRALDHRHGGGRCREAAVSRLPSALALLDHSGADHVSGPLHDLAGWSCLDTGLTATSARHFRTMLTIRRLRPCATRRHGGAATPAHSGWCGGSTPSAPPPPPGAGQ